MLNLSSVYFAILTLATSSAYSAHAAGPLPFYAGTVKDYLVACEIHLDTCSLEVGTALMNKLDFRGVAQVCLEAGYDERAIVDWLALHPETHRLPTEDGIYLAMKSLYPCK